LLDFGALSAVATGSVAAPSFSLMILSISFIAGMGIDGSIEL